MLTAAPPPILTKPRPKSLSAVFEYPKSLRAFSSYVSAKEVGRSVGYMQTRTSTGLVVNPSAIVMSAKVNSRFA